MTFRLPPVVRPASGSINDRKRVAGSANCGIQRGDSVRIVGYRKLASNGFSAGQGTPSRIALSFVDQTAEGTRDVVTGGPL